MCNTNEGEENKHASPKLHSSSASHLCYGNGVHIFCEGGAPCADAPKTSYGTGDTFHSNSPANHTRCRGSWCY